MRPAAIWDGGDRPGPHGSHTGPGRADTPHRRPHGALEPGHAPAVASRGPEEMPRPHSIHTGPIAQSIPHRQKHGAQGTGHAPTAATQSLGNQARPQGGYTRSRGPATPNGNHTAPRRLPTPLRRPYKTLGTVQALTAAIQGHGEWPRPHGGQTKC